MSNTADSQQSPLHNAPDVLSNGPDDAGDFLRIVRGALKLGLPQIVALALLGLVIAGIGDLLISRFLPVSTSTEVVFSFPGFVKGQYPDGSKFSAEDLIGLDIVA